MFVSTCKDNEQNNCRVVKNNITIVYEVDGLEAKLIFFIHCVKT